MWYDSMWLLSAVSSQMSNYNRITFKERVRIEAGIYAKESFSKVAKELGRSTSSITREVKQNRTWLKKLRLNE